MIMARGSKVPDDTEPRFGPGELVRHRRYHYRAVVVQVDPCCQADEAWYHSNQTQPDRSQPWYHLLVHDSASNTYAAEGNLATDPSQEQVNHPLVDRFFSDFWHGRYVRNDRPWPQG